MTEDGQPEVGDQRAEVGGLWNSELRTECQRSDDGERQMTDGRGQTTAKTEDRGQRTDERR